MHTGDLFSQRVSLTTEDYTISNDLESVNPLWWLILDGVIDNEDALH